MGFPSTALGIETGASELRVVQLSASGQRANVTGYAAVARPTDEAQLGKSVGQLIAALDTEADIPINLVDSAQTGERALNDVLARLAELGLNNVDFETVEGARERAVGRNNIEDLAGFIDCPIPPGLLAAHDRLAIADLAVSVGAALARLGLGFSAERASDDHIAVWTARDSDDDETDPGEEVTVASAAPTSPVAAIAAVGPPEMPIESAELAPTDMPKIVPAVERSTTALASPHGSEGASSSAEDDGADNDIESEAARALGPLAMVLGLIAVIGIGLIGFLLFGGAGDETAAPSNAAAVEIADDEPDAADPSNAVDVAATPVPTATVAPVPTATPVAVTTAAPAAAPTPAPTPAPTVTPLPAEPTPAIENEAAVEANDENVVPLSELPQRGAIYRASEGLLYLQGPVTAEEASTLEARAIEVLGAERVVNEYVIRADAPPVTEGNVRVEQAVLFETGSATIAEAFVPTLELGVLVLNLNPQVTMIVEGHTDDVGTDDANQVLSEARAQSVVEYLVGRGIDRSRLVPVGFGESQPIADNASEAGRQLNRRIEVDLVDLLSPRPADS